MKKALSLLTKVIPLVGVILLFSVFVVPHLGYAADAKSEVCSAIGGCSGGASSVESVIKAIVNILSIVVGIAAVIMIIVGGFKYITSSGDSNNVSSAKNTIVYAIVGLIIAALAQVIVRFVLSRL